MTNNPIVKGKLICVALNDTEQFDAMQIQFNEAPYNAAPTQPVLYFKPHNTWSTDGAVVEWGTDAEAMVVGASLAIVFGRECCRVSQQEALDYVEGYTLVHDFSLPEQSYYRPDIKGKCLDGSAPIGATVVPSSDIADPQTLTVVTKVNGQEANKMQVARTVRGVAELISTTSYIMTLHPGDVIAIGFPGNRAPVNKGDKVSSAISGTDNSELCELNNQLGQ